MVSVVSTLDFQNLYSYLDIHRPNYTTNAKKIQIHYIKMVVSKYLKNEFHRKMSCKY